MNIPKELANPNREECPRSLLDLIELETINLELATWLVSHVSRGASFMTGAGPGGIGKTTMMRALLGFSPARLPYFIALPGMVSVSARNTKCVVSHELSSHPPPTYLWGQDLRDFFSLSEQGNMLVGNMHTDDLEETRSQICEDNDIPKDQFRALKILAFIRIEGVDLGGGRIKDSSSRRFLSEVCYSDGTAAHETVYTHDGGLSEDAPGDVEHESQCAAFLEEALAAPERTIGEVRRRFLEWEKKV